ncbi:BatD family protein [Membranihabitans marinus]|uniref:BatD family protein n=1 Tax=Membranihabitans marinus TaxID=1227546 RepID=UPI001F34E7B2|nr:BatD family protein [Membranihabitans marinus]
MNWLYNVTSTIGLFLLCCTGSTIAQEVETEVSYDTVYMGNYLGLRYTIYNWEGQFADFDLGDFTIIAGPNTSSTMSISGNQRKSKKSYTFILNPPSEPGIYTIPSQKLEGEDGEKWTDEKIITILENPENIQQNPQIVSNNRFSFDRSTPTAPKRGQRQKF